MFLWAKFKGLFDDETSLNLPSLSKMSNLLEMVGGSSVSFNLTKNALEYKGSAVKFKYHLFDDGILTKPKITIDKISRLTFDESFTLTKSFLRDMLKRASIMKDSKKLYIYTEDGSLTFSLCDRTKTNTDTLTIVGEKVDFELDDFILNLDNVRLIEFGSADSALFKINPIGIGQIEIVSDELELSYIVTSITQ